MKYQTKRLIYCVCFSILLGFNSCNIASKNYDQFKSKLKVINASPPLSKIPKDLNNKYLYVYNDIQDFSEQLNLKSIVNDDNELILRVWFNIPGLAIEQRLVIINFSNDIFSAELMKFKIDFTSVALFLVIVL